MLSYTVRESNCRKQDENLRIRGMHPRYSLHQSLVVILVKQERNFTSKF